MHAPRRRRAVSPPLLFILRPLFRYSHPRDAYVLRGIGRSIGPVLVIRPHVGRHPRSAAH